MIDFNKKIEKKSEETRTNPIEIYDTLDRTSETGPLRPSQNKILDEWFNRNKEKRNLIIKLHTGEGKTLIGLLILLSKIRQKQGPVLYLCPNKYLVDQTCLEAEKFGVPYSKIEKDNELPDDFLNSKKILITNIQKLFNGKTKFGIDSRALQLGGVLIDDSHICIDAIKDACSITIKKDKEIFSKILDLFEEDLRDQGEGTFLDIKNNEYDVVTQIPYWSWLKKTNEVLNILHENKDDNIIKFAWPLIKDEISKCNVYISGHQLEITPIVLPIRKFGSYWNAKQRILMSATTQDDSFFIKNLGFFKEDILYPLTNENIKWSGEKLILLPSVISETLDRDLLITSFSKPNKHRNYGAISIVPRFKLTKQYEDNGALTVTKENINQVIKSLKEKEYDKLIVFTNRYDGIDLPDSMCRLLILDSMPFFNKNSDRYEEYCRPSSDLINIKLSQKIEQGIGRSVRGEKDYSIILIIGNDIVKFIKSPLTNKYFSEQMKKQIEIGLEVSEYAKEDVDETTNRLELIHKTISQILDRDDGWKEFYNNRMNEIEETEKINIYDELEIEKKAEEYYEKGEIEQACNEIQKLADKYKTDNIEKGWYLQIKARYKYHISRLESNHLQKSAFQNNYQLIKPQEGIEYKKINFIDENRINNIKNWVKKYSNHQELMIELYELMGYINFGVESEKFERSFAQLGEIIGLISQRPDKEIRKGPDILWCGQNNKYFLFECKSEVSLERTEITKTEAAQMNSHCGWFEQEYGQEEVYRYMIIPTKELSYYGNFTHDVKIIRRNTLRKLRKNVINFYKEFNRYNIDSISNEKITELIDFHKLDYSSMQKLYSEDYYHRSHV